MFDSAMPTSIINIEAQPENRNSKALTDIRFKNRNRHIIGKLNISSIRNKFGFLCSKISRNLNLLVVSEAKLGDSFPTGQFLMSGFCKSYRLDRCLLTAYKLPENVECLFVEINIRKKK